MVPRLERVALFDHADLDLELVDEGAFVETGAGVRTLVEEGLGLGEAARLDQRHEAGATALLVGEDANEEQVTRALAAYQARSLVIRELPASLRRYASVLGPLASGERVVAALPFGISLE